MLEHGAFITFTYCFISARTRAVFDGGSGGFDPPQEVADPQKVLQNLFGGGF